VTSDPYPDLPGAEPPDALLGPPPGGSASAARADLSDADSRLLEVLSRPGTHVVRAAEDDLRAPGEPGEPGSQPLPPSARRGPVTPVFQEPAEQPAP
jgi:hypothetical protein